jgi:tight adherence protein B
MRRRCLAFAVATAVVAVVIGAGPATAADGRISRVTAGDGALELVFTGVGLPADAELDHRDVTVAIDGQTVGAVAVPITSTARVQVDRTLVLVIDTSGSMKGDGIAGAKDAAAALVRALPANVRVGLVTFADSGRVVVPPTVNHQRVSAAIGRLVASGETALYDGVLAAVTAAGSNGERRLLLLSDGGDTVSVRPEIAARTAVQRSGVTLDAVGFRTQESVVAALQKLALAGDGKVVTARTAAALASQFQSTARDYTRQLVIRVPVPDQVAGRQVSVRVEVNTTGGAVVSDEVSAAMPALAPTSKTPAKPTNPGPSDARPELRPAPVRDSWLGSRASLVWAYGALFLSLSLFLTLAVVARSARLSTVGRLRQQMSLYTLSHRPKKVEQESSMLGDSHIARSAMELAGRVASKRGLEERLSLLLDRAGLPLRPSEWILIQGGVSVGTFAVLGVLSRHFLVGLGLGAVSGIFAPNIYLRTKAYRRQARFVDALPDSLQLIAGSLSAGYSLPQGVDAVVREAAEPTSGEFARALAENRLGVAIEDALDNVAERMGSTDFHWVVMAIRVQREVGGNLAEVLTTVAVTIRERQRLHRQVRALSAEGRLSAYVLIGLPVAMATYMLTFRRSYIEPLYTRGLGIVMLTAAIVLVITGSLWMRKLIKVVV